MSLADELLEQAEHLAMREKVSTPAQASLRRALSAAYYALFHLLAGAASAACCPAEPPELQLRVQRALDHGSLKDACNRVVSAGSLGHTYAQLLPQLDRHTAKLKQIAELFVVLQEERHSADYDLRRHFTREDVLQLITETMQAFEAWEAIVGSPETNVFLADCCFGKKWGR